MPLRQLYPDPPVYGAADTAKVDIIAVHGLNPKSKDDEQHAWDTWRTPPGPNGHLWLREDLPHFVPDSRIFLYEYNSTAVYGRDRDTFTGKASELLEAIRVERDDDDVRPILFLGHSMGGLLIKQALINAHNNPKYTEIRNATTGLAFFATPHNGGDWKLVSLGSVAAKIATATGFQQGDDVLETLKQGSIFSDIMHELFRQQLMKYDIISFWGARDTAVPPESARLGLPGDVENVVKLNADHRSVCKFSATDRTDQDNLKFVRRNIKDLYNSAIRKSIQTNPAATPQIPTINGWNGRTAGYTPPGAASLRPPSAQGRSPSPNPHSRSPSAQGRSVPIPGASPPQQLRSPQPPPLPPRYSDPPPSSGSFPGPPSTPSVESDFIVGSMYFPTSEDPRSIQVAEFKNTGFWEEARTLEHQMFDEFQKTFGLEHESTLRAAYDIAYTCFDLGFLLEAEKWINWVTPIMRNALDARHHLALNLSRLTSEVSRERGNYGEAEANLVRVLMDQRDLSGNTGPDTLESLETERALGIVCHGLGRIKDAAARLEHRTQALTSLLGENHVMVASSAMDYVEVVMPNPMAETVNLAGSYVHQASKSMQDLHRRLLKSFGANNQVTIRALRVRGVLELLLGNTMEASELLYRAHKDAENTLGKEHPDTLNVVIHLGFLCNKQDSSTSVFGTVSSSARLHYEQYAAWLESRKGLKTPEVQATMSMLAMSYMGAQDYLQAEKWFEKLVEAYAGTGKEKELSNARSMLELCQMNTRFLRPRGTGGSGDIVSMFANLMGNNRRY
ncbi:hypothetical protein QBC35DRAFT_495003 [Podospora australis]|uniref:DUF676 domain-containing protein n=1 Tax=Podospora australis TaxID=1536484 RepID=A0AAN6WVF5_9PEZI|nr:hypothetical protein QBC35DRAFT_495003 [Podospora australis]